MSKADQTGANDANTKAKKNLSLGFFTFVFLSIFLYISSCSRLGPLMVLLSYGGRSIYGGIYTRGRVYARLEYKHGGVYTWFDRLKFELFFFFFFFLSHLLTYRQMASRVSPGCLSERKGAPN